MTEDINTPSAEETSTLPPTESEVASDQASDDGAKAETTAVAEVKSDTDAKSEEGSAVENSATVESGQVENVETQENKEKEDLTLNLPWYVVHTYSGFEARVKLSLEERIRNENLQDKFGRIIVPQETVVELVRGEKKTSTRKFFPGYMLLQVELNDETWHLVNGTPKVTGFVGHATSPMPLTAQEVQTLFEQMEGGAKKPRPKVEYENGDSVKVVDGPFADFNGIVDEVKPDKGKLRVLISIFGRNTPVELDFVQVEKV